MVLLLLSRLSVVLLVRVDLLARLSVAWELVSPAAISARNTLDRTVESALSGDVSRTGANSLATIGLLAAVESLASIRAFSVCMVSYSPFNLSISSRILAKTGSIVLGEEVVLPTATAATPPLTWFGPLTGPSEGGVAAEGSLAGGLDSAGVVIAAN